jgi:iron complex outermembrane receptor protein
MEVWSRDAAAGLADRASDCLRGPGNAHAARMRRLGAALAACGLLGAGAASAAQQVAANLADLSLEQLGNIEVTSVSRRSERLADAASSIFVISADDIRRSGATTLPEALRLAPNLQVARADANQYAISARGYNSVLTNKMLVLIDGRTVYSPLFSGVFWEVQDVMLEDVERIEVISGPGGTLWGSNAVNGVINITTRSARDTQGSLLAAGIGNQQTGAALRHGGTLGAEGHYRIYGKFGDQDATQRANGVPIGDSSDRSQLGFRADWGGGAQTLTLQGDAYRANIDQLPTVRKLTGYNLLGRWNRRYSEDSELRVQAYYDRVERDQPGSIRETLDTYDVELQHGFKLGAAHKLLWGGGYRYAPDRTQAVSAALAFVPASQAQRRANVFVQDEITVHPRLSLTLGLKLERNEYTGVEALPSARLAWKVKEGHLLWGALSRSVRAPSRIDRELVAPANPPYTALAGGPNFISEVANVAEIGYRAQISPLFSFSASLYHREFDRLRSTDPSPAGPVFVNKIAGRTDGLEMWGTLSVSGTWRINGGVVTQNQKRSLTDGSNDVAGLAAQGNDPKYWWSLRSSWDLGPRHELDVMLRYVSGLPNPVVPGYTAVDARLGWKVTSALELSLVAQNLFDRSHPEWGVAATRPEFTRGVFLKALWRM